MERAQRSLAGLLVGGLIVLFGGGSATASRSLELRGSEGGVASSGRITFSSAELSTSTQVTCDVTLLRTVVGIQKRLGVSFGRVTGVAIDRGGSGIHCRRGEALEEVNDIVPLSESETQGRHRELSSGILLYDVTGGRDESWSLIYDSFQGTLPLVIGFNIHFKLRVKLILRSLFTLFNCIIEGHVFGLVSITRETGVLSRGTLVLERTRIPRSERSHAFCPAEETVVGTLNFAPVVTVRLV